MMYFKMNFYIAHSQLTSLALFWRNVKLPLKYFDSHVRTHIYTIEDTNITISILIFWGIRVEFDFQSFERRYPFDMEDTNLIHC